MKIRGLQKTTLLDFPERVAATVFLGGCNFRCPFCHNADLLEADSGEEISEEELLDFLKKRAGILDGVCITGGEPTLWPREVSELMRSIRRLGLEVKLDTNGYRPHVLKELCAEGLVDYVAMDIKAGRPNYPKVCGVPSLRLEAVEESAAFLMEGRTPYEFRTTAVKGLHTSEDFADIAEWISGCRAYFLQGFVDSGHVLTKGWSSFSRAELCRFAEVVKPSVPCVQIRGVDY